MADKIFIILTATGLLVEPSISSSWYPCFSATTGIILLYYVRNRKLPEPLVTIPLAVLCDLVSGEPAGTHSLAIAGLYIVIPPVVKFFGMGSFQSVIAAFAISYAIIRGAHYVPALVMGTSIHGRLFWIPFEVISSAFVASSLKAVEIMLGKKREEVFV